VSAPPEDRRAAWTPPAATPARSGRGVPGALNGSRLFEQPRYAAEVARFRDFVAGDAPLAVEVGFDFGHRILDHARRWPATRWLGLEVRQRQVDRVAAEAPPNLLAWRADARTVFAALMPVGRVQRVDVLFPTPWWDEGKRAKRLLLTADFLADVARALAPGGVVHVATDVGPYFTHVEGLFAGWWAVPHPPAGEARSRRERVCARDGLPVWRGSWTPAETASGGAGGGGDDVG
jgi:tRNA (guanine-N(7)-)-methyltransferase